MFAMSNMAGNKTALLVALAVLAVLAATTGAAALQVLDGRMCVYGNHNGYSTYPDVFVASENDASVQMLLKAGFTCSYDPAYRCFLCTLRGVRGRICVDGRVRVGVVGAYYYNMTSGDYSSGAVVASDPLWIQLSFGDLYNATRRSQIITQGAAIHGAFAVNSATYFESIRVNLFEIDITMRSSFSYTANNMFVISDVLSLFNTTLLDGGAPTSLPSGYPSGYPSSRPTFRPSGEHAKMGVPDVHAGHDHEVGGQSVFQGVQTRVPKIVEQVMRMNGIRLD